VITLAARKRQGSFREADEIRPETRSFCRSPKILWRIRRRGGDIPLNLSDTDLELLARYLRHHSSHRNPMEAGAEEAFAEIVRRHLDLVFSAALRQVRSTQLAEEVAQTTFLSLARDANRLAPDTILAAWLYQVAPFDWWKSLFVLSGSRRRLLFRESTSNPHRLLHPRLRTQPGWG
jgi:hypothetical protein